MEKRKRWRERDERTGSICTNGERPAVCPGRAGAVPAAIHAIHGPRHSSSSSRSSSSSSSSSMEHIAKRAGRRKNGEILSHASQLIRQRQRDVIGRRRGGLRVIGFIPSELNASHVLPPSFYPTRLSAVPVAETLGANRAAVVLHPQRRQHLHSPPHLCLSTELTPRYRETDDTREEKREWWVQKPFCRRLRSYLLNFSAVAPAGVPRRLPVFSASRTFRRVYFNVRNFQLPPPQRVVKLTVAAGARLSKQKAREKEKEKLSATEKHRVRASVLDENRTS